MSEDQLKTFLAKVQTETSLQKKLTAASDADAEVVIAKEVGMMISTGVLKNAQCSVITKEVLMV